MKILGEQLSLPRHSERDTCGKFRFLARTAPTHSEDNAITPRTTLAYASPTDQRELLIRQCHRVLRFVLFGITFYLDRLHVVHLGRITDLFVRKHSLSDPGGGAVKKYLMFVFLL